MQTSSFLLFKLSQMNQSLGLLSTIQLEINMYKSSTHSLNNNTNISNLENIEKLFRIIDLRLKNQIATDDFLNMFTDWNKNNSSLLTSSKFFEMSQSQRYKLDELLFVTKKLYLTEEENLRFLTFVVKIFQSYTNHFLTNTPCIGIDQNGRKISKLSFDKVSMMEEIFYIYDHNSYGHIDIDKIFFFYIAILTLDISNAIPKLNSLTELDANLYKFLVQLGCSEGKISMRQFKKFLLANEFYSMEKLKLLKRSSRKVIKLAQEFNDITIKTPSVLLPSLLGVSLTYNISEININDIKKNSPAANQLLAHYFLNNFIPYAYNKFFLRGIMIQKSDELIEMMCSKFLEYYPEDIQKNIRWDYDIMNLFTGIIKTYEQLAKKLLVTAIKFVASSKPMSTEKGNIFEKNNETADFFGDQSDDFSYNNKRKQESSNQKRERSFSPVLKQINRGFEEIFGKYLDTKSPSKYKLNKHENEETRSEVFKPKYDIKVKKNLREENTKVIQSFVETSYRTPSPNKSNKFKSNTTTNKNGKKILIGNKHISTFDEKLKEIQITSEKENKIRSLSQERKFYHEPKNAYTGKPVHHENIRYGPRVESFEDVMRKLSDVKLTSPIQLAQQKKNFANY